MAFFTENTLLLAGFPGGLRGDVSETWFIVFIGVSLAALLGLFLYGWRRRKEKPPPGVKPLTDADDEKWK